MFDVQRCGSIRVESFKLGILILCGGPLTEKYIHLFNLATTNIETDNHSDSHNDETGGAGGKIGPPQLARLVFDCIQVPRIFGEVAYFGGRFEQGQARGYGIIAIQTMIIRSRIWLF